MTKKHKLGNAVYGLLDDGATYPITAIYTLVGIRAGLPIEKYEKRVIDEMLKHGTEIDWFERVTDTCNNVHYRQVQW